MYEVIYTDLGRKDYKETWNLQEETLREMSEKKLQGETSPGHLYFVEHNHVYTLGKSGSRNNLLIGDEFLRQIGAVFYQINRGGDITYHGPGQIVGYPVFDLDRLGILVKRYVYLLEESVIQTLQHFSVKAERLTGATGVWIDAADSSRARKICAIGVRVSRGITMHGFAFNVNTNLDYFHYINPCGFTDKGVTSMEKEIGEVQDFNYVKNVLRQKIQTVFELTFV